MQVFIGTPEELAQFFKLTGGSAIVVATNDPAVCVSPTAPTTEPAPTPPAKPEPAPVDPAPTTPPVKSDKSPAKTETGEAPPEPAKELTSQQIEGTVAAILGTRTEEEIAAMRIVIRAYAENSKATRANILKSMPEGYNQSKMGPLVDTLVSFELIHRMGRKGPYNVTPVGLALLDAPMGDDTESLFDPEPEESTEMRVISEKPGEPITENMWDDDTDTASLFEDEPEPEKVYTKEEVVELCKAYSRVHGPANIKALFKTFGAEKLAEIDPAKYPTLVGHLK